ncbi:MAG TPA: hypothetical protein DGT23_06090 [Micromonosporaceae bacterium]|nr:hypothetical protein [Micromonosporaceae bacterium]
MKWPLGAAGGGGRDGRLLTIAIFVVPQVVNTRVPERVHIPPGTTFVVGDFRYTPEHTWQEVRAESRPAERSTVTDGTLRLAVEPVAAAGSLRETYARAAAQAGPAAVEPEPVSRLMRGNVHFGRCWGAWHGCQEVSLRRVAERDSSAAA